MWIEICTASVGFLVSRKVSFGSRQLRRRPLKAPCRKEQVRSQDVLKRCSIAGSLLIRSWTAREGKPELGCALKSRTGKRATGELVSTDFFFFGL
jgi:hypothetical protein